MSNTAYFLSTMLNFNNVKCKQFQKSTILNVSNVKFQQYKMSINIVNKIKCQNVSCHLHRTAPFSSSLSILVDDTHESDDDDDASTFERRTSERQRGVVIRPPVVGQGGEVEEVFDARQVGAHRPRAAAVLQAAAGTQVASEMVAIPGCLVFFYHNEMTQRPNRLIK